jgi:uncharacterized protein YdeI (YjbR/CyaY-like superfamily)
MNPKVDFYFNKAEKWQEELRKLREIILDCELTEELKWGVPCYSFEKKNIVLIHAFKEYCAILFIKGALLNDDQGILIQQTENVQAGRQVRFTNLRVIEELEPILKVYIYEAIEVEKAGLKVNLKKTSEFSIPEEFQNKLNEIPALKSAPKDFPADFPDIDLLKFKHYTVIHNIPDTFYSSPDFLDKLVEIFKVQYPFNRFLNEGVGWIK